MCKRKVGDLFASDTFCFVVQVDAVTLRYTLISCLLRLCEYVGSGAEAVVGELWLDRTLNMIKMICFTASFALCPLSEQ